MRPSLRHLSTWLLLGCLIGGVAASPLASQYAESVDRESAYERLTGKIAAGPGEPLAPAQTEDMTEEQRLEAEILGRLPTPTVPPEPEREKKSGSRTKSAPMSGW